MAPSEITEQVAAESGITRWHRVFRSLPMLQVLCLVVLLGELVMIEASTFSPLLLAALNVLTIILISTHTVIYYNREKSRRERAVLARSNRIREIANRRSLLQQSLLKVLSEYSVLETHKEIGGAITTVLTLGKESLQADAVSFWLFDQSRAVLHEAFSSDDAVAGDSARARQVPVESLGEMHPFRGNRVVALQPDHPLVLRAGGDAVQTLLAPVFREGIVAGYLVISRAGKLRWKLDEESFVGSLADGISLLFESHAKRLANEGQIRAEARAQESAEFLRAVLDTNPNLIFVKDAAGRFTMVNKAVAQIFGMTSDELIGKTDHDLNMPKAQADAFRRDDSEVLALLQEKFLPDERLTDHQGRVLRLQTVKRPLFTGEGKEPLLLGVATDVTAWREIEERLVQSQKLHAVGQLAGGIAHDFNNLLTGMVGYAQCIVNRSHDHEVVANAEKVITVAEKASALTQALLAFSRQGKHQHVPVDMHEIVEGTLDIIRRTIPADITVHTTLGCETPFVEGDPVQLQQVVLNLAINARDAMMPETGGTQGGRLQLSSRLVDRSYVGMLHREALARPVQSYVEIGVEDTGCGMSAEVVKKCLDPFFTTKRLGKGSGMGLAMVHGILESHQGYLSIQSSPSFGTTMRVYLPLGTPPERQDPVHCEPATVERGSGKVLIVDDHQEIRDVASSMVAALGYQVDTACDGSEAIAKILHQHYDLVLLDMLMPRMNGKDTFREIRRIRPQMGVVFSSGHVGNNILGDVIKAPCTTFLPKPYRLEQLAGVLAKVVREVADSHRPTGAPVVH